MRLASTAVAVAITPHERKSAFPSPATAGPIRTRIDIEFIFTSTSKENGVYVAVYKGAVAQEADVNRTPALQLAKIIFLTKKLLCIITKYDDIVKILNPRVEASLAAAQISKILANAVFQYRIDDANYCHNIKADDGKLKPEFVEALFKRDQAALDDIIKSRDIDL